MLKKLLSIIAPKDDEAIRAQIYRNVIREAAKMGGNLFGPIPEGSRREFFCLDKHTWIWHEEWTDTNNIRHTRTTRYDISPQGILKAQDGQPYQPVGRDEAYRLLQATNRYKELVNERWPQQYAVA